MHIYIWWIVDIKMSWWSSLIDMVMGKFYYCVEIVGDVKELLLWLLEGRKLT